MNLQKTLEQYIQYIKFEKGLSENSVTSYQNDLNRYIGFLQGTLDLEKPGGVTLRHIEQYIEALAELNLSASSVARNISSIRSFHTFAMAEGYAEANPADSVDLPRQTKTYLRSSRQTKFHG